MASGYGRGGRGAALLQALNQPVRKPGQQEQQQQQQAASTQSATTAPVGAPVQAAPPVGVPLGRGAHLAGLLQGTRPPVTTTPLTTTGPVPVVAGPPVTTAPPVQMPMGRGLAAMQALLQGRGQALPGASRGMPVQPVKPAAPQPAVPQPTAPAVSAPSPPAPMGPQGAAGPTPPTSAFERMSLQTRRETVHKPGSSGKPLQLSGNYIRIQCQNKGVYQYHVDFNPQVDSKNMRFKMVAEHRENVIGYTKAFDGTILYLPIKLPQQETTVVSKRITDGQDIRITFRLTKVLPPESCVQLYNIIFRKIMSKLEMVQVGRYYYNPNTPSSVPQHKLEVWPGYITAVKEQEGGLMLLADASHRVLRTETVLDCMQNIVQRNASGFQDEVTRTLVGTVVLTRYNNKTYRVDDIIWDKTPKHTFTSSSGEEMSFVDYYMKAYQRKIIDLEQPLLLHRPKRRMMPGQKERKSEVICLIPELCYMTGLTDALRQDFKVMKDLGTHTRVTPEQRRLTMMKFVNAVNKNPEAKEEMARWGLEFYPETISLDGRQLLPEKINYGDGQGSAGPNADWGGDATRRQCMFAVEIRSWLVLCTRRDQQKANDFISMMSRVCPQMGIKVSRPDFFELRDDRVDTFVRGLRDNINNRLQVVVIICPTSRDDRYSAIKKICCVECPIPSQVIIAKTIGDQRKLRSVTQKIALQINCKLGGELWAVEIPMTNLMIVGIDVYHDKTSKRGSIAGFVASTNKFCTRWFSRVHFQSAGQELVDGLKMCLIAALRKYHEVNHTLPKKIVVFRDGVGDGQMGVVAGYEVEQLKNCFSHFGEDYDPGLAVVVVQKRINTRIFLKTPREMQNPPPGTVVDNTITQRDWYDFFLVSQHVRQGTVTPTHYVVVHDGTGMSPDHMQRLSYKMTHMYYNWPGTVRVPAPCQYAHKLAYLVGQNIHKEPSHDLSDRLFFL